MRHFISFLSEHGGHDLSGEEIADILWLATHLDKMEFDKPSPDLAAPSDLGVRSEQAHTSGDQVQEPEVGIPQHSPISQREHTDAYLPGVNGQNDSSPSLGASPFRSPAAAALPQRLAMGRALRPLKRTTLSSRRWALDEGATVQRIAEEGNWVPVMRPAKERWLDLVLLVDESPSMAVWHRTMVELQALLERQGAFRNIQRWGFYIDSQTRLPVRVYAGSRFFQADVRFRRADELNDPSGRRLVLMVSDCVSTAWSDGRIENMLHAWNGILVSLVQVLPYRLWNRTGLRHTQEVALRSSMPGRANRELTARLRWHQFQPAKRENTVPDGFLLPVVTLEPELLSIWAAGITAKGGAWMNGVLFSTSKAIPSTSAQSDRSHNAISTVMQHRFDAFQKRSSEDARLLAGYLATVPLNLPVMRLVQQVMFDYPSQTHLAEVLLSGLVERKPGQSQDRHPDEIEYEFLDGARELLRRTVARRDLLAVLSHTSHFVDANTGHPVDFSALLADPTRAGEIRIDASSLPFATVAAETLHRFGGAFAIVAEHLQRGLSRTVGPVQPDKNVRRSEIQDSILEKSLSTQPDDVTEAPNTERLPGADKDKRKIEDDMRWLDRASEDEPLPAPLQRPPRRDLFVGRQSEIEFVLKRLLSETTLTVVGANGVGKSALVAEAIWRMAPGDTPPDRFPDGIVTYSFGRGASIDRACEYVVRSFALEPYPTPLEAAKRAMADRQALIVLMQAERVADLSPLLPLMGRCSLLCTAQSIPYGPVSILVRVASLESSEAERLITPYSLVIELAPLPSSDAVDLLRRVLQDSSHAPMFDDTELTLLVERVGGLPLALKLCGHLLVQFGETPMTLATAISQAKLLEDADETDQAFLFLLRRTLGHLRNTAARTVLDALSWLAPAPADQSLLATALEIPKDALELGLAELVESGLLAREGTRVAVAINQVHGYLQSQLKPQPDLLDRLVRTMTARIGQETELGTEGLENLDEDHIHALALLASCAQVSLWEPGLGLVRALLPYLNRGGFVTDRVSVLRWAVDAAQSADDESVLTAMLTDLGNALGVVGQNEEAVATFEQALKLAQERQDILSMSASLNNLGLMADNSGFVERALDLYDQALVLAKQSGDLGAVSRTRANLGLAYETQGRHEDALRLYRQALEEARLANDWQGEAILLGNMGNVFAARGQFDSAKKAYRSAYDLTHSLLDERTASASLANLGIIAQRMGDLSGAFELLTEALELGRRIGDRRAQANALFNLAEVQRKQGQSKKAVATAERALTLYEALGSPQVEIVHQVLMILRSNTQSVNISGGGDDVTIDAYVEGAPTTRQIQTAGGALIGGNVIAGGDFVGRDRLVYGDEAQEDTSDKDRVSIGYDDTVSGKSLPQGTSNPEVRTRTVLPRVQQGEARRPTVPPIVNPLPESARIAQIRRRLLQHPGIDPARVQVVRAPLRISPLGAHIDHQLGVVTGMTIDRSILMAYTPTDDGRVEVESLEFTPPVSFALGNVPPYRKGDWANNVRGAVLALQQHRKLRRGLIGVIGGRMPIGGLGSSAAVTVAYLLALEAVNDLAVSTRENVEHCRYTENRYIGLNNGILDQSVILHSRHDHLTRIDCATMEVDNVPTRLSPEELAAQFGVLVVYSGVTHALVGTDYNDRVAQCRDAAATLLARGGQPAPDDVRLRHVATDLFTEYGHTLDVPLAKRARHFFGEMDRVARGVDAWQRGDLAEMGRLVTASGESSIKWYECGSPQLVTLYETLAETPGVLGTRFSGAGFRGNCLALIDPARFYEIAEAVHRRYPAAHPEIADKYSIHLCRPDGSAALISLPDAAEE